MSDKLDQIDRKILAALQDDGAMSATDVADRVGLSHAACWRRIQALKEQGVIKRTAAILDRHKLGLGVQVFVAVRLSAQGRTEIEAIEAAVRAIPEVLECYLLMGETDLLLRVVAADTPAYERLFFDKLSRLPGVQEIKSNMTLSELKSETALPIVSR